MWNDEGGLLLIISGLIHHVQFELVAHHGEEDGEVVQVGEDLPDHRLQLDEEQNRVTTEQTAGGRMAKENRLSCPVSQ